MSNLVSNPCVIVLLFLVPVMAYLIYLCAVYKAKVAHLLGVLERGTAEIRSLKEDIAKKKESRKLYTFDSATDHIENVIHWREYNQHLRLTLYDGSLYVVNNPSRYKLIIQDQSEEEI